MTMLFAAARVFLGIHLLIAGTRVRDAITSDIGEGAYLGLFSLASLGAIVWLVISLQRGATSADDRHALYAVERGTRHLAIPIVLIAFLLGRSRTC